MNEPVHMTKTQKRLVADNFGNTELGLVRISKNLGLHGLSDRDVVRHCHKIIVSTPIKDIEIRGKNYYFWSQEYFAVLTINRSSLGIITAKKFGGRAG